MPSFEGSVDFEVYCNTCGAGLCQESDTTLSYRRSQPQLRVNACPSCMAAKDQEIEELKAEIADLKEMLSDIE